MKPPFTSTQEMYNYAANQLMVQNLSEETVKQNLMEHGVTDADAEIVVQNMMVEINKRKSTGSTTHTAVASSASTQHPYGSFANLQEMYNYAANQLIVEKQSQQTTKRNLLNHGLTDAKADEVIKNMLAEMEKNKSKEVSAKKGERGRTLLAGLVIFVIGAVLYGFRFNIAGQTIGISYGIMITGAIIFFKGLFSRT